MDYNMIMRSGKYAGYTIGEMAFKDPNYYRWIRENRPEMLKNHKPSKPKQMASYDKAPKKTKNDYRHLPGHTIKPYEPGTLDEAF